MFKNFWWAIRKGREAAQTELSLRSHIIDLDQQLARSRERIRQLEQKVDMLERLNSMHETHYRKQS